jgi:hypothetical protein
MNSMPQVERDLKADAIYIELTKLPIANTVSLDPQRRIDYASNGQPIGIELLDVSGGVNISNLPRQDDISSLLRAKGIDIFSEPSLSGGLVPEQRTQAPPAVPAGTRLIALAGTTRTRWIIVGVLLFLIAAAIYLGVFFSLLEWVLIALGLVTVLVLVAGMSSLFYLERRRQRHDSVLQSYLDHMYELLLHERLRESEPNSESRQVARTQTLLVLQRLAPDYKALVVQFLYESGLLARNHPIVSLKGADLRRLDWPGARLVGVNLAGVDLRRARLNGADLTTANLHAACLDSAELVDAKLVLADLGQASLLGTDLRNAVLAGANLFDANLLKAANPPSIAKGGAWEGSTKA